MNTTISFRIGAFLVALFSAYVLFVVPAYADHGDEVEVESHATTAHEYDDENGDDDTIAVTTVSVASTANVENLETLLALLTQLVELLQEKKALMHDETPHEHENEDVHEDDDHEEDDNDEEHE